jgi:hypothetical protein
MPCLLLVLLYLTGYLTRNTYILTGKPIRIKILYLSFKCFPLDLAVCLTLFHNLNYHPVRMTFYSYIPNDTSMPIRILLSFLICSCTW